jgi:hydrogenase maturation protein HypF
VGFRPFVYRLAVSLNLKGFVLNTVRGVEIEVEGRSDTVDHFIDLLPKQLPPASKITKMEISDLSPQNDFEFQIRSSRKEKARSALISPDIGICEDCLRELFDPENRRHRYPFINCTNCGPRYTIIKEIPYDRPTTTMSMFRMCPECQREYDDPENRRFHAQPNCCPVCGPEIWLTDSKGQKLEIHDSLLETVRFLKSGKIVAVKGLGGFHLACDAANDRAVSRLRARKHREEKPLAVMAPDLSAVSLFAEYTDQEKDILLSPRRPIVLLNMKSSHPLSKQVAPKNDCFGVMLPYTPLHHLILREGFTAIVMTSGNISEEPIAIGNEEALKRLGGIADFFLMHNRDIYLRSDDSVTRVIRSLPRPIRRSRGMVPVPIFLKRSLPSVLAVGGELKNTICLTQEDRAFVSQHIGDLENAETLAFFEECVDHLERILQIKPDAVAHDLHPDYLSTQWASDKKGIKRIGVQHHHAHIASCLAENGSDEKVIGLALDGTGYGSDGHVWGGEILIADLKTFQRAAHFDYRPMPGGEKAIREPWRMALSYLYFQFLNQNDVNSKDRDFFRYIKKLPFMKTVGKDSVRTVVKMIENNLSPVMTSSLGRLFDGVAALIGLRSVTAFEGQAAMELEMAMGSYSVNRTNESGYEFELIQDQDTMIFSPDKVIRQLVDDVSGKVSVSQISLKFHTGLLHLFLDACRMLRDRYQLNTVALSGGCFQNRFLLENLSALLETNQFKVLTHSLVPANDGGLALGQAVVAGYRLIEEMKS